MELSSIFNSVLSLFIMIMVGFYSSKKKIITSELNKGLTDILIKIALPFLIVSSFMFTYDDIIKDNVLVTLYLSLLSYAIMFIVSFIMLLPIKNEKKIVLHFGNVFVNTGYVGFPVLNSIFGFEGVVYGSIFNLFFVIFLWTYGILLYKGNLEKGYIKNEIVSLIWNPSIMAVLIGIIIILMEIEINTALLLSIKSIGSITGPISMFIIGVILSNPKVKKYFKDWVLYYGIAIKLIIIPSVIYFMLLMTKSPSKVFYSVIIMTAMPASAMTSILAEKYNKEKEFAAIFVSATTLISLLTVPLIVKVIM